MALSEYSTTTPEDTELAGNGAQEIVGGKSRIKERYELDHNFDDTDSTLDPTEIDCDGYHKQLTMPEFSGTDSETGNPITEPENMDNAIFLYFKKESGIKILYFKSEETEGRFA